MTWKGFAGDKLVAEDLVANVKLTKDLDFSPVFTTASTLVTKTMLLAPNQPLNNTAIKLFVAPIRWRKPEAGKLMAMKVVKIIGYLFAEILQR